VRSAALSEPAGFRGEIEIEAPEGMRHFEVVKDFGETSWTQ
jgi:hypothetical protein